LALKEVNWYSGKLKRSFGKIEQKIVDLNDARFKLSSEELCDLEDLTAMHMTIKRKFLALIEGTQMFPPKIDPVWQCKQEVEKL
jgi:hypothetical protein